MSIYLKLVNVQNELKAPKGQYNSFGKYKYRNQEDILEAVKPLLLEHNLTLFIKDEVILIGERYYIKSTCILIDTENGEKIENSALARESETKKGMDDSQITGSTSSYARKYALNGLFLIDDTKDADTDEFTKRTKNETTNNTQTDEIASEKQIAFVRNLLQKEAEKKNVSLEKMEEAYSNKLHIKNLNELTRKMASSLIKKLND